MGEGVSALSVGMTHLGFSAFGGAAVASSARTTTVMRLLCIATGRHAAAERTEEATGAEVREASDIRLQMQK